MLVTDTAFFIAFFRQTDAFHARAHELKRQFSASGQMMLATTHVVEETVTYIRKHDDSEKAYEVARLLLDAENISIESVSRQDLEMAAQILRKYKRLSLCDSLNVVLARKHGLKQIVSFDAGFDHVEKIERIH